MWYVVYASWWHRRNPMLSQVLSFFNTSHKVAPHVYFLQHTIRTFHVILAPKLEKKSAKRFRQGSWLKFKSVTKKGARDFTLFFEEQCLFYRILRKSRCKTTAKSRRHLTDSFDLTPTSITKLNFLIFINVAILFDIVLFFNNKSIKLLGSIQVHSWNNGLKDFQKLRTKFLKFVYFLPQLWRHLTLV